MHARSPSRTHADHAVFSKCLPENRNWALGEKCEACEKGGQPCGPNERYEPSDTLGSSPQSPPLVITPFAPAYSPGADDDPFIQRPSNPQNEQTHTGSSGQASGSGNLFNRWSSLNSGEASGIYPNNLDPSTGSTKHFLGPQARADGSLSNYAREFNNESAETYFWIDESISHDEQKSEDTRAGDSVKLQAEIVSGTFEKLGAFTVANAHLHDLRKAVPHKFQTRDQEDVCQQLEQAIKNATWAVQYAFRRTSTDLIESAHRFSSQQRELLLHKASKACVQFENAGKRRTPLYGEVKLRRTILRQLLDIAQAQDDVIEVAHLQEELCFIAQFSKDSDDRKLNEKMAHWLRKSADVAYDVLCELEIADVMTTLKLTDRTAVSATHRAMYAGLEEVAKVLLEKDDPDSDAFDILQRSSLHIAVETGCLNVLLFLLKQHLEMLNSRDILQRTPILLAASKGDVKAFDMLAAHGADIHARDMAGHNIEIYARASSNQELFQKLVNEGVIFTEDAFGVSPLLREDVPIVDLDCFITSIQPANALTVSTGGNSSRSTPAFNPFTQFCDGTVPGWTTPASLDISSDSSISSTTDTMSDIIDFNMLSSGMSTFGGKR